MKQLKTLMCLPSSTECRGVNYAEISYNARQVPIKGQHRTEEELLSSEFLTTIKAKLCTEKRQSVYSLCVSSFNKTSRKTGCLLLLFLSFLNPVFSCTLGKGSVTEPRLLFIVISGHKTTILLSASRSCQGRLHHVQAGQELSYPALPVY